MLEGLLQEWNRGCSDKLSKRRIQVRRIREPAAGPKFLVGVCDAFERGLGDVFKRGLGDAFERGQVEAQQTAVDAVHATDNARN